MIVVDVGCHPHGSEESVYKLRKHFMPELLFGFDPYPGLVEGVEWNEPTMIVRRRLAASTTGGLVSYLHDGIRSRTMHRDRDCFVGCFDLGEFLMALPDTDGGVVLKLDCEGAEYPLLENISQREIDRRLALVLVEWHDKPDEQGFKCEFGPKRPELRCHVEEWT